MKRYLQDLLQPVMPAERLAALRLLVGVFTAIYLFARSPALLGAARFSAAQFAPVGPVKLLSAPLPAAVVYVTVALTLVGAVAFVAGFKHRLLAPIYAALLIWVTSYRNSFGMIFHTENLFVLHVAVLACFDAASAYAASAPDVRPQPARRFGLAVRLMGLIAILCYFLAGVAKLRASGSSWVTGDALLNHVAYDNLRKALLGDALSPIGVFALHAAWLFKPLAFGSLALEVASPLAWLVPRLARPFAFAMWSFHLGVLLLMAIFFPYPLFFIAFAPFFEAERFVELVRRKLSRFVPRLAKKENQELVT